MRTLTMIAEMLGLAVIDAIWSGYVLTCLWGWFVVPTFALPPLTLAQAIGVSLIVGYLTNKYLPKQDNQENGIKLDDLDDIERAVDHVIFPPAFALLAGLLVKQWM